MLMRMPVAPSSGLLALFALLGLVFGSFCNVLILRLPEGESLLGRSHCPSCKRTLRWWDLVPVVSFLLLRGRCAQCKKRISWQYPLIETACGGLFVFALMREEFAPLRSLVLGTSLSLFLTLSVIDLRTHSIPDLITLPLLALCVAYAFLASPSATHFPVAAPLIGGGFFALQWAMSRGRWIGSGDILIGFAAGLLTGEWHAIILTLFCSYISGALVAVVLLATKRMHMKSALPFIPFLSLGTLLALIAGDRILPYLPF